MKCLRCGYCCTNLFSIVVDDPDKGPVDGNLIANEATVCKHLRGDKVGEFACGVHDRPWYKDTPCNDYTQVEHDVDTPCRRGAREIVAKQEE